MSRRDNGGDGDSSRAQVKSVETIEEKLKVSALTFKFSVWFVSVNLVWFYSKMSIFAN